MPNQNASTDDPLRNQLFLPPLCHTLAVTFSSPVGPRLHQNANFRKEKILPMYSKPVGAAAAASFCLHICNREFLCPEILGALSTARKTVIIFDAYPDVKEKTKEKIPQNCVLRNSVEL